MSLEVGFVACYKMHKIEWLKQDRVSFSHKQSLEISSQKLTWHCMMSVSFRLTPLPFLRMLPLRGTRWMLGPQTSYLYFNQQ